MCDFAATPCAAQLSFHHLMLPAQLKRALVAGNGVAKPAGAKLHPHRFLTRCCPAASSLRSLTFERCLSHSDIEDVAVVATRFSYSYVVVVVASAVVLLLAMHSDWPALSLATAVQVEVDVASQRQTANERSNEATLACHKKILHYICERFWNIAEFMHQ